MRISQVEANDRTAGFGLVNLAIIANEVVELFDAAAEEKGIHIELTGDRSMLVMGDRDLLFEAISNLVDNSIKYGRAGGRVTVELNGNEDDTILAVADNGPGIPADECQHVFKRFYRLEQSRRTPGNGLGLSLVDAVARLHGVRIEMRDNDPGLHLQLRFPAPATSSDVFDTLSPTQANLARRDVA
jgi:signal transduction histidine kinase